MVQMSLLSFKDTHLEVDRVANDIDFGRLQIIEQITVVPIVVTHGIIVLCKTLLHEALVVDVAFFHAEDIVQARRITYSISRKDGVTHP